MTGVARSTADLAVLLMPALGRCLQLAHVIITEGNSLRLSDAVAGRGVMPLT
jgi:hypothetical protein